MATQQLEVLIIAKNQTDAAFKQLSAGLNQTDAATKKASQSTTQFTETQQRLAMQMAKAQEQAIKMNAALSLGADATQRAAMRMNNMHEEALRMNASMKGTNDQATILSANVGALGNVITSAASSLGAGTQATAALGAASNVASVAVGGITKATIGFNAATLSGVGAAAAFGVAIGSLVRDIPAVAGFFDKWATGNAIMLGMIKDTKAGLTEWQAEIAKINAQAKERQALAGPDPVFEAAAASADKMAKASAKAYSETAAAAKKSADERAEAEKRAVNIQVEATNYFEKEAKESWEALKKAVVAANEFIAKDTADAYDAMQQKVKDFAEKGIAKMREEQEKANEKTREQIELYGKMGDVLGLTGQLFDALGLQGNKALTGLLDAGNAAVAVFTRLASGDIWGAIMAGISGIISLVKSLASLLGDVFDFLDDLFGGGNPYKTPIKPFPNFPNPKEGEEGYLPPEGGGFAEGGWFPYQPGGHRVTVGEAGNEAVLNEPQIQQLVAQAVAMAMAANGGSYQGGSTVVQLNMDSREVGRAVITKGTRRRQSKVSAGGIRGRA